jgi:hypothetical protein
MQPMCVIINCSCHEFKSQDKSLKPKDEFDMIYTNDVQ